MFSCWCNSFMIKRVVMPLEPTRALITNEFSSGQRTWNRPSGWNQAIFPPELAESARQLCERDRFASKDSKEGEGPKRGGSAHYGKKMENALAGYSVGFV